MNCIIFIASTTGKNLIKMKQLHQQFGTNIPRFLQFGFIPTCGRYSAKYPQCFGV